jgi:hypothetical protein
MVEEKISGKDIALAAIGIGGAVALVYGVYKIIQQITKPLVGETELRKELELTLADLKTEKDNYGTLDPKKVEALRDYYRARVYAYYSQAKTLNIKLAEDPATFEKTVSTWSMEDQAIAWKSYQVNLVTLIGKELYPTVDWRSIVDKFGLAAILIGTGITAAIVLYVIKQVWKLVKPTPCDRNTGDLSVDSTPQGASVYIDNILRGTTPLTTILIEGTHSILVKKEGYKDITDSVTIKRCETTTRLYTLEAVAPQPGAISVPAAYDRENKIPKTKVYLVGNYVGDAIWDSKTNKETPLLIKDLAPGSYGLTLVADGYYSKDLYVTVYAGQITYISKADATMTRMPQRFTVPWGWIQVDYTNKQYNTSEAPLWATITPEVLSWMYKESIAAWRYAFESYWGHPYEYYYPPPQPTPETYTFDSSTWELLSKLLEAAAVIAFFIITVWFAIQSMGISIGRNIIVPSAYANLKPTLESNFPQYGWVVG